jgi:mannose-6-phosphate isomerase-like protein (cupin superfamily)
MRPGETIEAPNMGMRVTCRESAASSAGELLSFDFWMRGGATPPPMHVHPHQEERITVVRGSVRSRSGGAHRVLLPGETVVSPPGEAHTVGPAGNEDVEMVAELRPALSYEQFMERTFALDRAGQVNAKGRGNPLRMATTKPARGRVLPAPHPNRAAANPAPRAGSARPTAPRAARLTKSSSAVESAPSRPSRQRRRPRCGRRFCLNAVAPAPLLSARRRSRRFADQLRDARRSFVVRRRRARSPDSARAHRDRDDDEHDHADVPYGAVVEEVDNQQRERRRDRRPIHPGVPDPIRTQHSTPVDALAHRATIPPPPVAVKGRPSGRGHARHQGTNPAGLDCGAADPGALDAGWRPLLPSPGSAAVAAGHPRFSVPCDSALSRCRLARRRELLPAPRGRSGQTK